MASYTKASPGAPTGGLYAVGDVVTDSVGVEWHCVEAGFAAPVGHAGLRAGFVPKIGNLANAVVGAGAANGTGVAATEFGDGVYHKTVLTLTDFAMTVTDALAYAGSKIYDFPEGRILFLGSTASLAFAVTSTRASTINDSAAMDWSLGSVTASSVTLASTMVDLLPKVDKTLDGAVAAYTTASTGALAAAAQFDGTSTALDMYLNVSFPTTTDIDADGTMTVLGTITFAWVQLGDY